ncbi:hypothetical protein CEXT_283721 [Caerostris extrusa]|uniref:SOCS box domain-containing protein n=1 Tax=Caerostris extrusa TaxID=172846 RepID=A0AAV4R155_CAEEX|nr:hypothetical protein CEXT_283721 [Caerostris extrusa]
MHKKQDSFVNTQESARNHLDLNREIIYRLNLDSSVGVEIESTRNANVFPSYRKLGSIIQLQRTMDLTKPPGMSERRHFLLILTFACFNNRRSYPHVDVGLRMLWKSLPDAFLTYQEMEDTFQMETSELQGMYDYYLEAVQEYTQVMKPRCLQDLCRWTIRKTLDDNNLCLPNAIEELKVPVA